MAGHPSQPRTVGTEHELIDAGRVRRGASRCAPSGEGGCIISIGSNLAERVPGPELGLRSLSKAALVGLTKGLARDLGHAA